MKKTHLLILSTTAVLAMAAALIPNVSKVAFGDSDYASGTWVHYAQKLPGTVTGTKNGVREYWVHCGQNEYTFSAPDGATIVEGTSYDVSQFDTNDARYIIPLTGEYKSVIIDNSTGYPYYEEVPELAAAASSGWWYSGTLPEIGSSETMLWKNTANSNVPWFYVDTLNVTKVIDSWATWKETFYSNGGHTYAADEYVDGYYVIRADLTANQNINNESLTAAALDRGFKGTFDGRGHKFIVGAGLYNGGIFGIMNGATIKNTTFDTVTLSNYSASVFGTQANDSTFSNITINIKASSSDNNGYGRIISRFNTDNLLENIDINVASGVTLANVFGGNTADTNTFIDVTYKADSLPTKWVSADGGGSSTPSRGGIAYIPGTATKASDTVQDVLVSTESNPSLTLTGISGTVTGITAYCPNGSTYDLGTDPNALVIPDTLAATAEDHGDASIVVTTDSGSYYTVAKLVTKYISANADLAAVRGYNLETKVYGYFPMTNDIICDYSTSGIGTSSGTGWSTSANGFYGRFDGRGHTLKGNIFTAKYGLFGTMQGYSSCVNLNIYNDNFTGWGNVVFGIGCMGASSTSNIHIANVDVNTKSSGTATDRKGMLFGSGLNTIVMQHLSVTVRGEHASGTSISLFPANYLTATTRFNNLTFTTVSADTVEIVAGKGATNPGATVTIL